MNVLFESWLKKYAKKHVKIGDTKVINTELVYARAMALHSSDREVDTDNLLAYELSPLPTSMFADDGQMRQSVKSNLKKSLAVEVDPSVLTESIDFFFLMDVPFFGLSPGHMTPESKITLLISEVIYLAT